VEGAGWQAGGSDRVGGVAMGLDTIFLYNRSKCIRS
jgi:hypothetical protein